MDTATIGPRGDPQDAPPSLGYTHLDEEESLVIEKIRAADLALDCCRIHVGFYAVVRHSGLEWRTENKLAPVERDVLEWNGAIPIPSDLSATVSIFIQSCYEFQPMLGDGEQLRNLTVTVDELLDRSGKDPFTFLLYDGELCSSVSVIVRRQDCTSSRAPLLGALGPHRSVSDPQGRMEDATNQGHTALSRYLGDGGKWDIEHAIEQFEHALNLCPPDHPCRAAAQLNVARSKLIYHDDYDTDGLLDLPLLLCRNALAARPAGHPDRPSTLLVLAAVHLARFSNRRDEAETESAEVFLDEVMNMNSSSAENCRCTAGLLLLRLQAIRKADLRQKEPSIGYDNTSDADPWVLGPWLLRRFERFGDLAHLQQAISVLETCIRSIPSSDRRHLVGLANLGDALSARYDRLGDFSDLQQAILRQQDAVSLSQDCHQDKALLLNNLSNSFLTRFEHLRKLDDLEEAISKQLEAIRLTPECHPHKPGRLNNLGNILHTRFECLGQPDDLKEAISRQQEAVLLVLDDDLAKPGFLHNLGGSLRRRFEHLGELDDLEEAISMQQKAVHLTPAGHSDMPTRLNSLGISLKHRFNRLGELDDLEAAISRLQDAIRLIPDGHPHKPMVFNNLGDSLRARFRRLGELDDLEESILSQRDAIRLTRDDHTAMALRLSSLGNSLSRRFQRLGELSNLEEAISKQFEAVYLTPDNHPSKPVHLNNLGNSLLIRFERLGELHDLEEGIMKQREALSLFLDGRTRSSEAAACLGNLGNSLMTRFKRVGGISDLEESTSKQRDAVDLTPDGHTLRPSFLASLGDSLRIRFERLGELSNLEEAIAKQRDAVQDTPDGHPDKSIRLNNLGNSLLTLFEHRGEISIVKEAISRQMDAVRLTPDGHSHKVVYLLNLGDSLLIRFNHMREKSDLEVAILQFSHAACASVGSIADRFRASRGWIFCARFLGHPSLLDAYSVAILLLPQLAWIGLPLAHRYRELIQDVDLVREAAAAALDSGCPEKAVEWLEQGRSVVWGEMFQLRNTYDELSFAHPDHARRLRDISVALENASAIRERSLSSQLSIEEHHTMGSLQQEANGHRELAIERDELLRDIRKLPGFERFLLHKEFSQLRALAQSGPVVILNAARARCDALIVLADIHHVIHVPLPNFTLKRYKDVKDSLNKLVGHRRGAPRDDADRHGRPLPQEDSISSKSVLAPLWKCVVKPVLDALAVSTPGEPSRIFWCPTGPFAFLPLHAAGFYDTHHSQPGYKIYDFVVSSYVPTLSTLASSPGLAATLCHDLRLLAVRQPLSDGLRKLPGVIAELEHIREVVSDSPSTRITFIEPSVETVEEVLAQMKETDWVHFACHGIQDGANPTESGLCFADKRRLRLSDMIALSRPQGGLAFLSACQTAKGDEDLSDEAIHIAAGMLYADYRGVIGTMWSINDRVAPDLAKDVYARLFRNGTIPSYRDTARALHDAVGRLRERNVLFQDWLPFIHVGL